MGRFDDASNSNGSSNRSYFEPDHMFVADLIEAKDFNTREGWRAITFEFNVVASDYPQAANRPRSVFLKCTGNVPWAGNMVDMIKALCQAKGVDYSAVFAGKPEAFEEFFDTNGADYAGTRIQIVTEMSTTKSGGPFTRIYPSGKLSEDAKALLDAPALPTTDVQPPARTSRFGGV